MQLAVRTTGNPDLLVGPIRRILSQKDRDLLFAESASMSSIIDGTLADFRIVILSLSLFSAVALILTAIGLYGVLAYHVSQRSNEIGIRLAMGATRANLLGSILRKGLIMVGVGLLFGVIGSLFGTRLLQQFLFETRPLDAPTYVSAIGFLGFVALLACLLPAWRATRVSLVEVLRNE